MDNQKLQDYKQLLKTHDWFYTFSEDRRSYLIGHQDFVKLLDAQPELDPKFEFWNQYAPIQYRRKLPKPHFNDVSVKTPINNEVMVES